eukprot:TRINITY_DN7277_c0_g1_i1.p1 TRINITY_DN7277_c0_g1~~TRINITY_DN7277_c0_g1_i1.p1  ORF type:complete len:1066 (-),score=171.12 TRINITY_DN7277_c0_g1_i1:6-3176(-)
MKRKGMKPSYEVESHMHAPSKAVCFPIDPNFLSEQQYEMLSEKMKSLPGLEAAPPLRHASTTSFLPDSPKELKIPLPSFRYREDNGLQLLKEARLPHIFRNSPDQVQHHETVDIEYRMMGEDSFLSSDGYENDTASECGYFDVSNRFSEETYQTKYQEGIMDTSCDDREDEEIDNRRVVYSQTELTPPKSAGQAFKVVSAPLKKSFSPARNNPLPTKHSIAFKTTNDQIEFHKNFEDNPWLNRYKSILTAAADEDGSMPLCKRYKQFSDLNEDFMEAAEVYGKVIINERYVADSEKTIKPLPYDTIGGVMGGVKYMHKGIIFKFVIDIEPPKPKGSFNANVDTRYLYGGTYPNDTLAMKSGCHEVRTLARVMEIGQALEIGILVPLVCSIHYRGFRLLAYSVVPIHPKSTLVYGSNDAGEHIETKYSYFNHKMKTLYNNMNISSHFVDTTDSTVEIWGPGDVEAHWGTDGKFYLIDLARVYPPEHVLTSSQRGGFLYRREEPIMRSSAKKVYMPEREGAIFYNLLRPELVMSNKVPLCSDALSSWLGKSPLNKNRNNDVKKATDRIFDKQIPDLVRWCTKSGDKLRNKGGETFIMNLLQQCHALGINYRYLGYIRSCIPDSFQFIRSVILIEMQARLCKNIIDTILRFEMDNLKVIERQYYLNLVLKLFNSLLHNKNGFWSATRVGQSWNKNDYNNGDIRNTFDQSKYSNGNNRVEDMQNSIGIEFSGIDSKQADIKLIEGQLEYYIWKGYKIINQQQQANATNSMSTDAVNQNLLRNPKLLIFKYLLPMKCCLVTKYGEKSINSKEWNDGSIAPCFWGLFFKRLSTMIGVEVRNKEKICNYLNEGRLGKVEKFKWLSIHLKRFKVTTKKTHSADACSVFAMWGELEKMVQRGEKNLVLFKIRPLAQGIKDGLSSVLIDVPESITTLNLLGRIEFWLALYLCMHGTREHHVRKEEMIQNVLELMDEGERHFSQAQDLYLIKQEARRKGMLKESPMQEGALPAFEEEEKYEDLLRELREFKASVENIVVSEHGARHKTRSAFDDGSNFAPIGPGRSI